MKSKSNQINPSNYYPPNSRTQRNQSQPSNRLTNSSSYYENQNENEYLNTENNLHDDPNQLLRLTRSATETIHEAISEDNRRRLAKKFKTKSIENWKNNRFSSKKFQNNKSFNFNQNTQSSASSSSLHPKNFNVNIPPMPIAPESDDDPEPDEHTQNLKELEDSPAADLRLKTTDPNKLIHRNIYLNLTLPTAQVDKYGNPIARYVRNKVRTTKYTIISFLPKNMYEQFRNVANIYFLILIIFQVFPIFGAATPQVAMLPLVFILSVTALKDAFEDYRRYMLDNSVNNAACTRLGDWKNVNVPTSGGGTWWENFEWPWEKNHHVVDSFGQVKKISKGVRKLREREKGTFNTDFLYNQTRHHQQHDHHHNKISSDSQRDQDDILSEIEEEASLHELGATSNDTPSQGSSLRRPSTTSEVIDYLTPTAGTAKWERTLWKKIEVGDVLLLREDEAIPADLVVLSTSDPNGQCFVETKNLDGETNLKPRKACKSTRAIANEEDLEHSHFVIDSEPPHANLYAFNAALKYWTQDEQQGREHPLTEGRKLKKGSEKKEIIGINEILLRGCTLRNTQWVIGLVIFTGKDTKIMLNQGDTPSKKPKISKETNYAVIVNFLVLLLLCTINAIGDGILQGSTKTSATFFEVGASVSSSAVLDALVTFGAALILFQSIVPISLVITLEFVRSIQALTIFRDIEMYYEPLNCPAEPKSWNLSDDLGQIEYIFSDKTGTLTQNVMEFQRCSISGISYGEGVTEAMLGAAKRRQTESSAIDDSVNHSTTIVESKNKMMTLMQNSFKHTYLNPSQLTLISPKLIQDLTNLEPINTIHRQRMLNFWRTLAICHDVIAIRTELEPNQIEYKAESPDEAALVAGARDIGFVFLRRMGDRIEIQVMSQIEQYDMLQMIPFNSSRKRMSTIVRCPDGKIKLLCKGADSIIMSRLRPDQDEDLKNQVNSDLERFASDGLRTLLIASREVNQDEFAEFQRDYQIASDSPGKDREDLMEKVADRFERGLEILGATALEDKLQVGVPEAIEKLHQAGIKLWILTGDKLQTAIEIGYSCNLLKNSMEIMILSSDTEAGARSQIEQGLEKLLTCSNSNRNSDENNQPKTLDQSRNKNSDSSSNHKPVRPKDGYAVVIDGDTLRYALDGSLKSNFLALTVQCETVVCCRVSPAQKALTVKLVKEGKNAMTLAIGDGANDVAMIQEAHIGVGIAGLEGAQASMSADYALGQFRFLTKLLLVHGRWCYIRIADMHANFFFKNIIWTLVLFWYQFYCSFNGSYIFEYTFIMLFNLVFTSLPVGLMGAFEQDVSANASLAFPTLYKRGIEGLQYTRLKFWLYMLDGTYQSIVAFWIPYFVYFHSTTVSITGRDVSIWEFGTTIACGAVFAANNMIVINTRYFPWFIALVIVTSSTLILIWTAVYSGLADFYFKNVVLYTFSTIEFWASFVLVPVLSILPRAIYKYLQIQYWPRDSDIIREIIIGKSYHKHQSPMQTGFEEDLKQLKLIEHVIEKDKLDRLSSERESSSCKKNKKISSSFKNSSTLSTNQNPSNSVSARAATIPSVAITTVGRSSSINRTILAKSYNHNYQQTLQQTSTDSVEMTTVHPSDYPLSGVPSITTTSHHHHETSDLPVVGLDSRWDTRRDLIDSGSGSNHSINLIDGRYGLDSHHSPSDVRYAGLATFSPLPSPIDAPFDHHPRDHHTDFISLNSSPQFGYDSHRTAVSSDHHNPHFAPSPHLLPPSTELDEPCGPSVTHSNWLSSSSDDEFNTCHSHTSPHFS